MPTLTRRHLLATTAAAASTVAAPAVLRAQPISLDFYYPIAVAGPITNIIDGYCRDFEAETGVRVNPVYAGTYGETFTKVITAIRGGTGPQLACLLAAEIHSLRDLDVLAAIEDVQDDGETRDWLGGFYDAFMRNSLADDRTWSVPFQRSTSVYFYDKDAFREAGLDPDAPPRTWAELVEAGKALVRRDGERVTRWGVQLAGNHGTAQWTYGALAYQADHVLMNDLGTELYFDDPKSIEAMTFWQAMGQEHGITPVGVTEWGTLPAAFLERQSAMIWSTTGNLTSIRERAPFDFGVAGLPGKDGSRTVVGGGNLYLFEQTSEAEKAAALAFAKWVTAPERAADWSIATGYIATRPDAFETEALAGYVEEFPLAAVARDMLPHATGELSTYENQQVYKALTDNIQACLTGDKSPEQAMADAQGEATRILRPFQ